MGLTGFNRRRREAALLAAKRKSFASPSAVKDAEETAAPQEPEKASEAKDMKKKGALNAGSNKKQENRRDKDNP